MSNSQERTRAATVADLLRRHQDEIVEVWLAKAGTASRSPAGAGVIGEAERRRQALEILRAFTAAFESPLFDDPERPEYASLSAAMVAVARQRAAQGFSPGETLRYPLAFKEILLDLLRRGAAAGQPAPVGEILRLGTVVDRLVGTVADAFAQAREDLIGRQGKAILELSTPVVKLWDEVLLLPVVGVIDTARAQQMVELLLESITRHEARVAILDITGVPVIDTRVARHLLVTIDAARLLGAETILTGISPDAAMTLTSLGIDLSRVRTKGSLRAGVAEAFRRVGRAVVALDP